MGDLQECRVDSTIYNFVLLCAIEGIPDPRVSLCPWAVLGRGSVAQGKGGGMTGVGKGGWYDGLGGCGGYDGSVLA